MLNIAILRLKIVKMQEVLKQKILREALRIVELEGWHSQLLVESSKAASLNNNTGLLLFPGGVGELVEFFINMIDQEMLQSFNFDEMSKMRAHEKVRYCIICRLKILNKYQIVCEKTIQFLSMPSHLKLSIKTVWQTVDYIWRKVVHDQSTDFSYYTKRMILMAVYSSTLMYWLSDDSKDKVETISFLDRRLNDVGKIHQIKKKISSVFEH